MSVDVSLFFARDEAAPSCCVQSHGFFIRGVRRSGKTSFAFQAAVNTVQDGARVVMLCQEHVLCSKVPQPFTPWSNLDEAALRRIEFVYVESIADVIRELSTWMTPHDVPQLVLIDDDSFTDTGDIRRTAQMLSVLENVYDWVTRSGGLFHYVFVSNNFPDRDQIVELPFAAFPLVSFLFGSTGFVVIQTLEGDVLQTRSVRLEWNDGLVLCQ